MLLTYNLCCVLHNAAQPTVAAQILTNAQQSSINAAIFVSKG